MDSVPFQNQYIVQSYNTGASAHGSIGEGSVDNYQTTLAPALGPQSVPVHQPFTPGHPRQHRFRPCGRSHDSNQNYNQYKKSKIAAANKENVQQQICSEDLKAKPRARGRREEVARVEVEGHRRGKAATDTDGRQGRDADQAAGATQTLEQWADAGHATQKRAD